MRTLEIRAEIWPLKNPFTISRGTRTEIHVVVAEVSEDGLTGRGEAFPHVRYGETVDSVIAQIASVKHEVANGITNDELLSALPHGAARNALDCALWDLETKLARKSPEAGGSGDVPPLRAWARAGIDALQPVRTVMTLSLSDPDAMAAAARDAVSGGHELIKVKLGSDDGRDDERIAAVRSAAPDVSLIVDANEGWRAEELSRYVAAMEDAGVKMIEQPLPAGADGALSKLDAAVPIGADECFHTRDDLDRLEGKYQVVNIKLDKAGGLTAGLAAAREAKSRGFQIMVGCMLGTSLAMAPAMIVAQFASFVDLDGPLWLAEDRPAGLSFDKGKIAPYSLDLWG